MNQMLLHGWIFNFKYFSLFRYPMQFFLCMTLVKYMTPKSRHIYEQCCMVPKFPSLRWTLVFACWCRMICSARSSFSNIPFFPPPTLLYIVPEDISNNICVHVEASRSNITMITWLCSCWFKSSQIIKAPGKKYRESISM